jgi:hypothetical protein
MASRLVHSKYGCGGVATFAKSSHRMGDDLMTKFYYFDLHYTSEGTLSLWSRPAAFTVISTNGLAW